MKNSKKLWLVLFLTVSMLVASSAFFAVSAADGYEIAGSFVTDNIGSEATVELVHDGAIVKTTAIPAFENNHGQGAVNYSFSDVQPGTYDIVFKKAGCLSYEITGVTVINSDINLENSTITGGANKPELISGDIDENGFVDSVDVSLFIFDMGKSDAEATYATSDFNGDGYRDGLDVAKLAFNMLSQPGSVEYDNPHINVVKNVFSFDEMNPNGSFWWGLVHPTLSDDGYKNNCYTTNVGNDIICGNLGAEGTYVDFSDLETDGNYLSFYVYVESDITTTLRTDVVSIRDVYYAPCSLIWDTTGLTKGWNHIILDIDDAINHGSSFDITQVQFVHFWLGSDQTNWCVDELSIIEVEDYAAEPAPEYAMLYFGSGYGTYVENEFSISWQRLVGEEITMPHPYSFKVNDKVFGGWSDGENLYGIAEPYTVTGHKVFTAVWYEANVSGVVYDFDEMNANGSSWWGSVTPTVTSGGFKGNYYAAPADKDVICGNLGAEGTYVDMSELEEDGKYLVFYVYNKEDTIIYVSVDLTSKRDAPYAESSASWDSMCLLQGWNPVVFDLDDATVGEDFDISKVQFVHFRRSGDESTEWGVDEFGIGELSVWEGGDEPSGDEDEHEHDAATNLVITDATPAQTNNADIVLFAGAIGPYDLTDYQANGGVHIELYVSDPALIGNGQLELSSNSAPDTKEINWKFDGNQFQLEEGWNVLDLKFSEIPEVEQWEVNFGGMDWAAVNYCRIYLNTTGTEEATVEAKNVYIFKGEAGTEPDYSEDTIIPVTKTGPWGTEDAEDVDGEKAYTDASCPVYCANVTTEATKIPDYVKVDLYVSDADARLTGIGELALFELNNADYNRTICWNLSNYDLVDGWNELTLDVDNAIRKTLIDISELTSIRYFQYTTQPGVVISVGSIEFGYHDYNDDSNDDPDDTPVVDGTTIVLESCDTADAFWGTNIALDNTLKVEGSGAVTATDPACAVICAGFGSGYDLTEYASGLTFYASVYVEDASKLNRNPYHCQFEIYSDAGEIDPCYVWDLGSTLETGWNYLELPLSEASINRTPAGDAPNLSSVVSFRIFTYNSSSNKIAVDNIYAKTSTTITKKYANNLFKLDSMSAYSNSSFYSKANWSTSGAAVTFSSEGSKLFDTGAATLNVPAGQTAVLAKTYSNTDLSKYAQDGYLYFWLYVDKASKITGGQLELTSSTQPDCYEASWNVTSLGLKDGWNEVKLKLSSANSEGGAAIWSMINYVRFYFSVNAQTTIKVEGLYFGTADDIASVNAIKQETSRDALVLENCDTLDNWAIVGNGAFVAKDSDEVEGKGYITVSQTGAGDVVFAKSYQGMDHWMNAVGSQVNTWRIDLREYKDSKLNVSMYISDPSVVVGGQIELTSSGRSDANEISWGELGVDIPLVAGWNHLELYFDDANIVGNPDYFEINYLRVYLNCSGSITMGLDNIYFGDDAEFADITFTATEILGTAPQTITQTFKYKDGARVRMLDIPAIATKSQTNFLGWSDGNGNIYQPGDYVTVDGDATFTAQYTAKPSDANVIYAYDLSDGGVSQNGIHSNTAGIAELESAVAGVPNATANNAVWMNSKTFGKVLDFSIAGSYAQASGVSFNMASDLTVETWFNAPDRTASNNGSLSDRYILSTNKFEIYLTKDAAISVKTSGTLLSSTVTASESDIGFDIFDEKWHHLKVVYDTDNSSVTIYVDGSSVKSGSLSRLDKNTNRTSITIGAKNTNANNNNNFDGHLAKFAITKGAEYYGYSSVTINANEYDTSTRLTLEKGIVIDRRQYWNFNPFTSEGATIAPNDIQNIKSLGFDHVKLLLTPNWLIDANGELIYENMSYIAPLLDEVKRQGFQCILCLHPEEGFKGTYMGDAALSNGNFGKLLNFYQDITDYVVENWGTDFIALQLMTEPNANSGTVSWDWIADRQWGAARNASSDLMLITSSDESGNFERLKLMSPVFDYNLVYSFTTYEPYTIGFNNYNTLGDKSTFWPYVKDVLYPVPEGLTDSQINQYIEQNIVLVPENLKNSARSALRQYYKGEQDIWRPNSYDQVYNLDWHMNRCASLDAWNQANGGNIHLMAVEFGCSDTQYNQRIFGAAPGSGISDEVRLTLIDHQTQSFEAYNIGWSYWSYNEYFHLLDTTKHLTLGNVCLSPSQFADAVDQELIDILLNRGQGN